MIRLIKFLYLKRVLLVFLFLEIFSIVLLKQSSPYYSASYFSSSNLLTASILSKKATVLNYFDLEEINKNLLKENAVLKDRLHNNNSSFKYIQRSYKNNFEAIEAMIINNTVNQNSNFITLDVGRNEGVENGMGVIGPEGILGRVYAVNDNYSTVTSILHAEVFTSVKIGRSGALASMNWDAKDARFMKINSLPRHVKIIKGDSIFTSGFNAIYPEGILLGVVEESLIENDKSFHDIKMKLVNNFRELKYAYIVTNKRMQEIEEIEKVTEENE